MNSEDDNDDSNENQLHDHPFAWEFQNVRFQRVYLIVTEHLMIEVTFCLALFEIIKSKLCCSR